jgi:Fic family protein
MTPPSLTGHVAPSSLLARRDKYCRLRGRFLACLNRAFDGAEKILAAVLQKAEFWKNHTTTQLNERQRNIINRLLDGFEGKLTSTKWATLEKTSPDTALRDINDLVARGILKRDEGGGRSTSYSLVALG